MDVKVNMASPVIIDVQVQLGMTFMKGRLIQDLCNKDCCCLRISRSSLRTPGAVKSFTINGYHVRFTSGPNELSNKLVVESI